jgi:hypothetical protein
MSSNHLIVGLGGSGGEIIRVFRKTIFQEFREEYPDAVDVAYLCADSSSEMMGVDDPSWKILGTSVQLNKNEPLPDLDRMVTFLSDLRYSGQNVFLIGFTDNTGIAESNLALSKNRAGAVATQFARRGIRPRGSDRLRGRKYRSPATTPKRAARRTAGRRSGSRNRPLLGSVGSA